MKKNVISLVSMFIVALAIVITPAFTWNIPFTGIMIEAALLMLLVFIPDVKRGKQPLF